jgi:hypothetical protein
MKQNFTSPISAFLGTDLVKLPTSRLLARKKFRVVRHPPHLNECNRLVTSIIGLTAGSYEHTDVSLEREAI